MKNLKMMKNISKIEEDVNGNESDGPLIRQSRRDRESIKERKRGLSSEDIFNINTYKLNTSAVLQKEFDKLLTEKRKNMKKKNNKETIKDSNSKNII